MFRVCFKHKGFFCTTIIVSLFKERNTYPQNTAGGYTFWFIPITRIYSYLLQ